ncbi:hypothetical protein FHR84_004007 [Actinopolyspora biskrensis]|uniref:Tn3 transposase DDE domain-containing protein n=1 Tax=Actinopolyspora biskrensis TaxID=1470178 RepID=A0A852Z1H8_9ACTN|nr:hypothetical protein [Actinopolyspora biskrensis]
MGRGRNKVERSEIDEGLLVGSWKRLVLDAPRDSLHVLDVLYDRDGGRPPEMLVTDTASYSDIVFGLLSLADWTEPGHRALTSH